MARGDLLFFEEAKAYMLKGNWQDTDIIKCAILDNTTTPTAADATPSLGDYTQVGSGGTYVSGGTPLGTWGDFISESGGTVTFDTSINPSWVQDAGNDTDAYWAIIYNDTDASDRALVFIDLGGPVDMTAGDLTITWNASGVITLT